MGCQPAPWDTPDRPTLISASTAVLAKALALLRRR